MIGYILTVEDETIGVIATDSVDNTYIKAREAIAYHFLCKPWEVSIEISVEDYAKGVVVKEFKVTTFEEDEMFTRVGNFEEVCIYN